MSERKVTFTLQFHALMPDDEDEAENFADEVEEAIIHTLRENFDAVRGNVAVESFEGRGWSDEEVT